MAGFSPMSFLMMRREILPSLSWLGLGLGLGFGFGFGFG